MFTRIEKINCNIFVAEIIIIMKMVLLISGVPLANIYMPITKNIYETSSTDIVIHGLIIVMFFCLPMSLSFSGSMTCHPNKDIMTMTTTY